ncbi:MAG: mechanosensitive ion channel family protein [Pseudomonadota bacterium]
MDPASIVQDRVVELTRAAVEAAPRLGVALTLILLTWAVAHGGRWIARKLVERAGGRRGLADVAAMLAGVAIWTAGLLIAATIAFPTVTPGRLLTALGLGSIAIGFAFKDIFENFFAGLLILVREPFDIGDHIATDELEGQVEAITIRDTRIRRTDGQLVVAPNAALFQTPVTVRTNAEHRRATVICGVSYDADVDEARAVIEKAVRQVDSVRDDVKDVQVFAHGFGASSIDFEIAWWTGSRPIDIRASRDEVVAAVKRALDEAGIEIPFPQRTLTFKGAAPVALEERSAA